MFHPDFPLGVPSGGDLLAELGIDPMTLREIAEQDRAMRCPEQAAVYPDRRFADLDPEPAMDDSPHEAGPAETWDPAPAGRRWRRA